MTSLTQDELLVLLCEEAAEATQAATKCLRFGFDTIGPGDYGRNDLVLAREVGEFVAIASRLLATSEQGRAWHTGYSDKIERAVAAKAKYGREA